MEPLASDIVVDSMIVDSGSVSSAITKIFTENAIKTKSVATSVSGHSVIVKKIQLQTMTDCELAESINTEAAQHIPFDIADVNVDYQILSDDDDRPADGRAAGRGEERQDPELHERALAGGQIAGDRGHRRVRAAELLRIQLRSGITIRRLRC